MQEKSQAQESAQAVENQAPTRRSFLRGLACGAIAGSVGPCLTGCGGGGNGTISLNGGIDSLPFATPPGTKTFFSPINKVLIGASKLVKVGRGFVTLASNNRPVLVGLQMYAEVVTDIPLPAGFGDPVAYGVNLPPEAVYTIFTFIAVADFSGHLPRGIGDVPHFHPVFVTGTPQAPDPPDFPEEKMPIAADELPQDHEVLDDVAGGIGVTVQDPVQLQGQLGWDSIGQNYFFYGGHMNALSLGATHAYLLRQQAGRQGMGSDTIKQPRRYPKPGYYPYRYSVRYDVASRSHFFMFEDFRPATNFVS